MRRSYTDFHCALLSRKLGNERLGAKISTTVLLIIHVHDPAYNPRHNMELDEADPRVCNARVLNWGCIRALQPEVSGRRWTKAKTDEANGYKVYETPDQCAAVPAPASGVQGS